MIRSFRDKRTEKFFDGRQVKEFRAFERQAARRLHILDSATSLRDLMNLPSNHFEALHGNRAGQLSIRINRQWCVCFKWIDDEAHDVEIVDYH